MPDIIDNAYVIVEFENGSRGMLDLCMFAEGSKNEQEISVVGDIGKVKFSFPPAVYAQGTMRAAKSLLSVTHSRWWPLLIWQFSNVYAR